MRNTAHGVLLVALLVPQPGLVQPGAAQLRSRCVTAADTFQLVITEPSKPDRTVSALTRRRFVRATAAGDACVIVQTYARPGASDMDSSEFSVRTLAPMSYRAAVAGDKQDFRFTADSALGTIAKPDSAARHTGFRAPAPFFLGVHDIEVIGAMPLAPGFRARFATFNPPASFAVTAIAVEGVDTLSVEGKPEPAWRISYDAGAAPTVLWLGSGSHRLLRSRTTLAGGAIFWRIRPSDRPPQ